MKYSTGRPPCVVVPASVKVNPHSRGTLMKFSQHLRSVAEPIWAAQLTHPFVVGLGNGTLPERKFKYYILQDALFLTDLAQVFAVAATKAPDAASTSRLTKLAEDTLVVERSDRKSTRLNSSHGYISYAVFCLKKKTTSTATGSWTCPQSPDWSVRR